MLLQQCFLLATAVFVVSSADDCTEPLNANNEDVLPFTVPPKCKTLDSCNARVLLKAGDDDNLCVELQGPIGKDKYVAMGISEDSKMGSDLVISCVQGGDGPKVRYGWNNGYSNSFLGNSDLPGSNLTKENSEKSICSFKLPKFITADEYKFDLQNTKYHLLLAYGEYTGGALQQHTNKEAAQKAIILYKENFKEDKEALAGGVSLVLIQLHGSAMVVAWVLCSWFGIETAL